jgi:hypothetical protein
VCSSDLAPPAGEIVRREISVEQRRRVEQDPAVRQALELFNGIMLDVRPTTG